MRQDLYVMFRWAVRKAFDKHPDSTISPKELKGIIEDVWDDMVEDGEIYLTKD